MATIDKAIELLEKVLAENYKLSWLKWYNERPKSK